jgi:hypothetical protein
MAESDRPEAGDVPAAGVILVAFEKLFGGGRGVELPSGAVLIEQNPKKSSEWAELARKGRRIAWVMRDGRYLARVVEGEVTFL